MEFANGKVPGSIYSIGYLVTDGDFEILVPPTDLDSLRSHIEALEQWCQQMGYDISFADIYEQIDAQSLQ